MQKDSIGQSKVCEVCKNNFIIEKSIMLFCSGKCEKINNKVQLEIEILYRKRCQELASNVKKIKPKKQKPNFGWCK